MATCPRKVITVHVRRAAGEVRIDVSDTGYGIAPEHAACLFSHGFTTKAEGHGFGLHMSALTARELGGTLSARSDGPGRGATFTLALPLKLREAAA